ncbi:ArsR/SmtB family transcription factor [Phytoactinopolyspora halotolerans]|uniref:Helix-turn-helix transcriptional regulator n=1 Tax=Phytoactinopolyspora halotolerans TaxID=1981512 RepID=A0A6L9SH56_9ACTN|nr:helix-turn-helix domain-containing protein [Phytoactinopolyspora halotolerans]NEE03651.1 helix-turn-helix transcriptional regulator [Phytoactinopolyspora halotolerans]
MGEERTRISDPQRLRALAHPLRHELLDVLRTEGEATATRCAELVGESAASCSFHLRMLAKYGFIERAEQRGRDKPWRLVHRSLQTGADLDDPASVQAATQVAAAVIDREMQRLRDSLARAPEEPREWLDASTIATSTFWATSEEMAEVSEALSEIADRFRDRWDDPSLRPEGARIVRVFGATVSEPASEVPHDQQ